MVMNKKSQSLILAFKRENFYVLEKDKLLELPEFQWTILR